MQPYFFPYLGYFQLMHAVDRFVFLDDVRFIKQGWINRNRILLDGEVVYLTVPVENPGLRGRICDVRVFGDDWRRRRIETLRHAYARAPHFREILPIVAEVISAPVDSIAALARHSVKRVAELLQIETPVVESSGSYGNDHLRGQDRILDIAARERADTYVNLPGGRELYRAPDFERAGIRLRFLHPEEMAYPQAGSEFVPRLSIIDLLMAVGAAGARAMLSRYTVEP